MYEFNGTVKKVGELQRFASGFEKQDLIVEEDKEGGWPNVVAFAFKKDAVSKLVGVSVGDKVKIGFVVNGREWTDPKSGKVKYFSDLTALRLEVEGCREHAEDATNASAGSDLSADDEGIPF